ncbi:MAG TPA: hypothetical protein VJ960_06875 [Oceanipulchritudo sp.]|nr:hypothetical protein [Oceanipulchritudo sp.]
MDLPDRTRLPFVITNASVMHAARASHQPLDYFIRNMERFKTGEAMENVGDTYLGY